jgi:zinc protease
MTLRTQQVTEYELLGGKLLIGRTAAKDIVAVEGSVFGGPNFLPASLESIPRLAAELLDAGTKRKSKEAIRESLANRGITLAFRSEGDRTFFSGQCFPEDLPFLLSIVSECLSDASFPTVEVAATKARELGSLAEAKTETRVQAEIAFSRLLFDPSHVNCSRTIEESEQQIKKAERASLTQFKNTLGRGGLVLVITGDVNEKQAISAAERAFGKLAVGTTVALEKKANKKRNAANETLVPIKDKANIDIFMGASLSLHRLDPLYQPLSVVVQMLGGSFAGHLMQTVRERDGLTYGIYAMLNGFEAGADGALQIWGTFSPDLYARGVATVREEIRKFFAHEITEEALTQKKEGITGSYLVGLSTARGFARTLHQFAIDGRPASYLVEYPHIINKITIEEAKAAAKLVPLDRLSLAAAGTFPKK